MGDTSDAQTSLFKKRKFSAAQRGRRRVEKSESSSEEDTQIVRKGPKRNANNPLVQSTVSVKSKVNLENASSSSSEEELNVKFKSRKTTGALAPADQGATATLEIETPLDRDAQAVYEKSLQINKELKGQADDKIYRGLANYTQFYEKRDTAQGNASSGMVRKGPIRAPTNLRATVRWDYQPDICKDYKETGFCGFGDSCKFLHDRTDYKHGWQLEQETLNDNRGNDSGSDNYEIESDDDNLPFKCFICRNSFTDPVITKCKHYFCEKCALDHHKKSSRCFICSTPTDGVFKTANEIIGKLSKSEDKGDSGGTDLSE
uniref:RING finger protein 113A n=1 Tax=Lygus hesperus TaxID=30085 RepID=A0A146L0X2_LYGHE